jgi:hypothetical protein
MNNILDLGEVKQTIDIPVVITMLVNKANRIIPRLVRFRHE